MVTDPAQVEAAIARAEAALGGIDILVSSAGIALQPAAIDMPPGDRDRVVAVNQTGLFLVSRAVARGIQARGRPSEMVHLSAILAFSGGGFWPELSHVHPQPIGCTADNSRAVRNPRQASPAVPGQ